MKVYGRLSATLYNPHVVNLLLRDLLDTNNRKWMRETR